MKALRAVIFDMDGVLCDSEPLILRAALAVFAEENVPAGPEDFTAHIGTGDNYLTAVAAQYGRPITDLGAFKERLYARYLDLVRAGLHAFPGGTELFAACRAERLLLALASSADPVKITANLAAIGLPEPRWDAVVSGTLVHRNKPAPDIFLEAAGRLGVEPETCAVIEDAVAGVRAARAAGARCVAVAHTFPAEALREADIVRARLAEVTLADLRG